MAAQRRRSGLDEARARCCFPKFRNSPHMGIVTAE